MCYNCIKEGDTLKKEKEKISFEEFINTIYSEGYRRYEDLKKEFKEMADYDDSSLFMIVEIMTSKLIEITFLNNDSTININDDIKELILDSLEFETKDDKESIEYLLDEYSHAIEQQLSDMNNQISNTANYIISTTCINVKKEHELVLLLVNYLSSWYSTSQLVFNSFIVEKKDKRFSSSYLDYNAINSIYLNRKTNEYMLSYDSFRNLSTDTVVYYGFSYGINGAHVCADPDIRTLSKEQAKKTKEYIKRLEKKLKKVKSIDDLEKYISIERVDGSWENYIYDDSRIENIFKVDSLDATPGGEAIQAPFLVYCDSENSNIAKYYSMMEKYIRDRKFSDMYKYLNKYVFTDNCKLSFPYMNLYCANKKQLIKLLKKQIGFLGINFLIKHHVYYELKGYLDKEHNSKLLIQLKLDNDNYIVVFDYDNNQQKIKNIDVDRLNNFKYDTKYILSGDISKIISKKYNDFLN